MEDSSAVHGRIKTRKGKVQPGLVFGFRSGWERNVHFRLYTTFSYVYCHIVREFLNSTPGEALVSALIVNLVIKAPRTPGWANPSLAIGHHSSHLPAPLPYEKCLWGPFPGSATFLESPSAKRPGLRQGSRIFCCSSAHGSPATAPQSSNTRCPGPVPSSPNVVPESPLAASPRPSAQPHLRCRAVLLRFWPSLLPSPTCSLHTSYSNGQVTSNPRILTLAVPLPTVSYSLG